MKNLSRRRFIKYSATCTGIMATPSLLMPTAWAANNSFQTLSTATAPFKPVKVFDIPNMPWYLLLTSLAGK